MTGERIRDSERNEGLNVPVALAGRLEVVQLVLFIDGEAYDVDLLDKFEGEDNSKEFEKDFDRDDGK
jgi:hypothetical protein